MLESARLVPIIGKGGVGRSTVTLALALAAEAHGRRTLIVELGGTSDIPLLLGQPPVGYHPQSLTAGIDIVTLSPLDCLADFGHRKMKLPGFVEPLFQSRPITSFVQGVPGLQDLLQLGKLENMLHSPDGGMPHYDICLLDTPATGHGLTLLNAPRTLRELTQAGPFAELARTIETFLHKEETAVLGVTLPETLPVAESFELDAQLNLLDLPVVTWVVNRVSPSTVPPEPAWADVRALLSKTGSPELLALGDRLVGRALMQGEAIARMHRLDRPLLLVEDALRSLHTLEDHRLLAQPLLNLFEATTPCPQ